MQLAVLAPAPLDTISGGYRYDRLIAAGLRTLGHDVRMVAITGRHPLADSAAAASAAASWATLEAGERPVIDGLALPAFADLAADFARRQAVGLIHHPTALETGRAEAARAWLRATECRLLPLLDRVIVTSDLTAERLVADFGVARPRIAVVVPGTADAPRSRGSAAGCNILSIGTLVPRKGHAFLLRALARLPDLDWRLTIVGSADRDAHHARTLYDLAADLGITSRVRFAGEAPDTAMVELWGSTDIFALATCWEGYGMAVAEALKRGIPVAVTAGGAAAALVPPEGGVVCTPGDVAGLSLALRRLIFDLPLRRIMAEAAWQAGQTLPSWHSQSEAFAAALD